MAKGRSGYGWARVRRACYKRDAERGARCWICGGPIDYTASNDARSPDYSRDAWEPDHYWSPLQRPELAEDPTNILPSHSRCNRARASEQREGFKEARNLGRNSREW